MGETTPGSLILVGAYVQAVFGSDAQLLAGSVAAVVVTWFNFLLSFLFILASGPMVESGKDKLQFTAPLTGISAAVVGVIASLALFFAYHVLWSKGFAAQPDSASILLAVAVAIVLLRFKRSVIQVITACALLGLLLKMGFVALA